MKKLFLSLAAALAAALPTIAQGAAQGASGAIVLELSAGPGYTRTKWFGPMPVKLLPQMAAWIETADGVFVDTIYATYRSGHSDWKAAKGARRPEALPIWSHSRGIRAADGLYMPDASHPLPDAISAATPKESFSLSWVLPAGLAAGEYRILVEVNSSYDWNESYPEGLPESDPRWSEVNGQPSLLWAGWLRLGGQPDEARLEPIGTGSPRGADGKIKPGLEGITSARSLLSSIKALYKP